MLTLPTRRPWLVLTAIAVVTLVLGSGLPRLKTAVNVDEDSLPKSDERVKDVMAVHDVFGVFKPVTVVVDFGTGSSVFGAAQLAIVRDLSAKLSRLRDLVPNDVTSLTEVSDVTFREGSLDSRRVVSFPSAAGDGERVRRQMLAHPLWPGRLFDDAQQRTILTSNVATSASIDRLYDSLQESLASVNGSVEALATGADVLPVALTRAIDRDMRLFIPLALLLVIVGFFFSFRSLGGVLLPLAVTVLAMIWLLGLMGLTGSTLNPVTTVLPPTLIALGSSYGIHFMNRYYGLTLTSQAEEGRAALALRRVAGPLVVAGATTAFGMATLIAFEIEMIRTFGLLMALGIVFVVILTLTFIPAMLSLRAGGAEVRRAPRRPLLLMALLSRLSQFCQRRARMVVLLTLVASVIGIALCLRLEVGVDLVRYFPPDHAQRRANALISDELGGAASATLMVDVDRKVFADGTRDPAFMGHLMAFGERLRRIEGVGHVRSLADIAYHIHRQIQRELAREGGKGAPKAIAPPSSSRQIDQLLLLYSMGAGISAIDELEDAQRRHAGVSIALRGWDPLQHRQVFAAVERAFARSFPRGAELTLGGDAVLLLAFDHYIVKGKLINIALTVLVVLLFCSFIYRSWRHGLLALIPVSFATIATFALMSVLGFRLTLATVVISSIGIGVGVDFAVHFLDHFRRLLGEQGELGEAIDGAMEGIGPAVVFDASSNVLGFAPLVFSAMVPVQHFGWLISFCMVSSALATLVILPAALKLTSARRVAALTQRPISVATTSEVFTR